jgi:primosomal protein N' (replication factor Y)
MPTAVRPLFAASELPSVSSGELHHLQGVNSDAAPCATVCIERGASTIERELTYEVPLAWRGKLVIGQAVTVSLRSGRALGFITGFCHEIDFAASQLKPLGQILPGPPLFDEFALKIARWMAAYYHCPLADCLAMFIPQGATPSLEAKYRFCAPEPLRALRDLGRTPKLFAIANAVHESKKPLSAREIGKILGGSAETDQIRRLCEAGVLEIAPEIPKNAVKARLLTAVRLNQAGRELLEGSNWPKIQKGAPKQAIALAELAARSSEWITLADLARENGIDTATLRALEKKGALEFGSVESLRAPVATAMQEGRVELTAEQKNAVEGIEKSLETAQVEGKSDTILLQGVTASGKTEVYLAAIEKCLEMGRRALVLVPEIALTAQTVEIFQRRFGSQVAILHSALAAGERFDEWRRAAGQIEGADAQIVVGARSAIFAPCREVGLIIIDEEHDGSYKQDATPRYHARDLAAKRAQLEGAVLVLGSATPSLESYARAVKGEYGHLVMQKRATGRPLPEVEIVDMTNEARGGVLPVLSTRLKDELCEVVARGEQAILFLNRRGYSTYVQCLGCGHVEKCPNCDVSLTHHKAQGQLRCHHCDHAAITPTRCPECDGWMIGFSGSGTEKVENEVEILFSERGLGKQNILRLDRDTTTAKGSHGQILGEFRAGRAPVLIGTQMVTKGLDFPRVTLVGVISADTALNVPDFRAAEKTFQLLSQVAGRAGRGAIAGRVLIQTLAADDIAITTAASHDFLQFINQELEHRQVIPNPPFSHVVNIISSDGDEQTAKTRLERLAARFQDAIAKEVGTEVLGPVSCPLARVKNKFRFHLLLRDRSKPRLHRILKTFDDLPRDEREGLTVDVDAMTIL